MEQDKLAAALENALFNWEKGGNSKHVMNALKTGLLQDMKVVVPFESQDGLIRTLNPLVLNQGSVVELEKDAAINYHRLYLNNDNSGKYLIPVFTSEEQQKLGKDSSCVMQPLTKVIEIEKADSNCEGILINPWSKNLQLNASILKILETYKPVSTINLISGSVIDMKADAIVNAANTTLLGGGGIDGAIHKAAGPKLLSECRRLNGCHTGEAKITGAYNITTAKSIIHTVGPIYYGTDHDATDLANCYTNCLNLALKKNYNTIAFPGISTGVYGYPLEEATEIALATTRKWFSEHSDYVLDVYFVMFTPKEYAVYEKLLKAGK